MTIVDESGWRKKSTNRLTKNRGAAALSRARKRVQVQELQAEVAIQEYANVILTQKLAERDAQIQGLLSNRASQHEGSTNPGYPIQECFSSSSSTWIPPEPPARTPMHPNVAKFTRNLQTGHMMTQPRPDSSLLGPRLTGAGVESCALAMHVPNSAAEPKGTLAGLTIPPHRHQALTPCHAGIMHGGIQHAQPSQLETAYHQLQSSRCTAYIKDRQTQQSVSWLLVLEPFPSHTHWDLGSTVSQCEEDSVSLWQRHTLDMCQDTDSAPSHCLPSSAAGVASHHQAESALASHMEDWEDGLPQEVYHRQILLQQQQLLLQHGRQQQQQQQQCCKQVPDAAAQLCLEVGVMHDGGPPQLPARLPPAGCLGADVKLITGGDSHCRSAS